MDRAGSQVRAALEATLRKWGGAAALHGASQLVIQASGFVTGLIVVRNLAIADYAQYSIAVAIIAATTLLSDSGMSAALMSRGSLLLDDRPSLAAHIRAGLRFRNKFGWAVIVVTCAWLTLLLVGNDATLGEASLYAGLVAVGLVPVLTSGVLLVLFRLELNLRIIRRVGILTSFLRLALVLGLALAGVMSVWTLLTVTALVALFYWFVLMRAARPTLSASHEAGDERPFFDAVRTTLPVTLSLIAAEQALIAMLTIRGTPEVIAQLNAMARFGVLFVIANSLVSDIAAPLIARTKAIRGVVARRVAGAIAAYVGACALLLLVVMATSPLLVALLGEDYGGLEVPLVIVAAGFAVANVAAAMNLINHGRGWMRWSWTYMPFVALWAILSWVIVDFRDIYAVSLAFLLQGVPALLTQSARAISGIMTTPTSEAKE